MSGLPTLTVKLDDGTGTFPYDVSAYVRLTDSTSVTRGTSDGQTTVNPATLSLTFENDGQFTPGSVTYGMRLNQGIQMSLTVAGTTYKRFTGFIQTIAPSWPDGGDNYSVVQVTAADLMTVLQRRVLRSMVEQEILADSPALYYKINEGQSAVSAGDTSGNAGAPLASTGAGLPPVFGAELNGTAMATTGAELSPSGAFLQGPSLTFVTAESVEIVFQIGAPPAATCALILGPLAELVMDTAGHVVFYGALTSPLSYADGVAHHAAAVFAAPNVYNLYVDGVLVGTTNGGGGGTLPLSVGGFIGFPALGTFPGILAHAAYYKTALSAGRVAAHAAAIRGGFTTDRSDQRISRLLGYAGYTGTVALEVGQQATVPAQDTAGANGLDAINATATSEGGLFFIRADGAPILQNRTHRTLETTPRWSVVAYDTDPGTAYVADTQNYANYVTAKAVTGVEQVAQNAASIAADGQYPQSLDLLVASDAEALDHANWLINTRQIQRPRLPAVTLDLLTASTAFQQTAMSVEISDRMNVSGMPAQAPATGDLVIEGWTETLTATSWSMAVNTSAWAPYQGAIYDTASATVDTGLPVYY